MVGDNLGWFFVLQEAVGEPRFGLDTDAPIEPSAEKWDNLAWADIDLGSGQAVAGALRPRDRCIKRAKALVRRNGARQRGIAARAQVGDGFWLRHPCATPRA